MALLLAILGLLFGALYFAGQQALDALPSISDEINAFMPDPGSDGGSETAPLAQELRQVWGNAGGMIGRWLVERATTVAEAAATMTGAFLSALIIIFFIVLLALSEAPCWAAKFKNLMKDHGQSALHETTQTLTLRLRRFLLVRTFVGLLQAALYVGWLAMFGIDLLIVWAVLTFILTYIPNIGSVISGALPVLYAFVVADPTTAFWIGVGIFTIEQVVGNLLDPLLQGQQILLSPTVILVALMFWGWLWGIAGAFLSTPIMLCLLVIFQRIEPLRGIALVLSNLESLERLDDALRPTPEST
jgi:AI-2 transport protein TqsA